MKVDTNEKEVHAQLSNMGFSNDDIQKAFGDGHNTLQRALDYIELLQNRRAASSSQAQTVSSSSQHSAQYSSSAQPQSQRLIKSTADDDLEHALQVSKKEHEEKQIADAILRSEQQMVSTSSQKDAADPGLALAIAQSLKETNRSASNWPHDLGMDPEKRVRKSLSDPVGLRNIGNTCYLNSLLQVYFHLPAFRRAVFSYRPQQLPPLDTDAAQPDMSPQPEPIRPMIGPLTAAEANARKAEEGSSQDNAKVTERKRIEHAQTFMIELQRLFARMALGNQSVVDPSELVSAWNQQGRQIEIGAQEDASEFNQLFLQIVELAIEPQKTPVKPSNDSIGTPSGDATMEDAVTSSGDSAESKNLIRRLFTTNSQQEVAVSKNSISNNSNDDHCDARVVSQEKGETNALFVDATTEYNRELYHGLDEVTQYPIEYREDNPEEKKLPEAGITLPKQNAYSQETTIELAQNHAATKTQCNEKSPQQAPVSSRKPALKSEWFTALAPVLTIYLKRVRYIRKTSAFEKVHEKYLFDTELAMDRYLEKNREEAKLARQKVSTLQQERLITERKLSSILSFTEAPYGIPQSAESNPNSMSDVDMDTTKISYLPEDAAPQKLSLSNTGSLKNASAQIYIHRKLHREIGHDLHASEYFVALKRIKQRLIAAKDSKSPFHTSKLSDGEIVQALDVLTKIGDDDKSMALALQETIASLVAQEEACYDNLRSIKYQLWAVLVHDGAPSSGHYLVFIRSKSTKEGKSSWMKFSDVSFSTVSEDEMLRWSVGGYGHASAYCLVYTRGEATPDGSQLFCQLGESILDESKRLLPQERLAEVRENSTSFDRELRDYRIKVRTNKVKSQARSIAQHATTLLKAASPESAAQRSARMGPDAHHTAIERVSAPPKRTRTIIEFCLATHQIASAVAYALHQAWSEHASAGSTKNLFDVVRRRLMSHEYPSLTDIMSTDSSVDLEVLVLEELIQILTSGKVAPSFQTGDPPFLNIPEAKRMPEILVESMRLDGLLEQMEKTKVLYSFALRSNGLAIAALSASLKGQWDLALWRWYHLRQKHQIMEKDGHQEPGLRDVKTKFSDNHVYQHLRHDSLVEQVVPSVLVAASDHAAELVQVGDSAGKSCAILVAEHAVRLFGTGTGIARILIDDWRTYLEHWRDLKNPSPFNAEVAVAIASAVIANLSANSDSHARQTGSRIDDGAESFMEEACSKPSDAVWSFDSLLSQVRQLGLIAADAPSVRRAARQLRSYAVSHTEIA